MRGKERALRLNGHGNVRICFNLFKNMFNTIIKYKEDILHSLHTCFLVYL